MNFEPQYTAFNNEMLCPKCGDTYTHIDSVGIAVGREDHVNNNIHVDALGTIETLRPDLAQGQIVGAGRRHRIVLHGTCENGGCSFALIFTQHKGVTFAEVI